MYFGGIIVRVLHDGRARRPYVRFFGYNDGSAADVACARAKKKKRKPCGDGPRPVHAHAPPTNAPPQNENSLPAAVSPGLGGSIGRQTVVVVLIPGAGHD